MPLCADYGQGSAPDNDHHDDFDHDNRHIHHQYDDHRHRDLLKLPHHMYPHMASNRQPQVTDSSERRRRTETSWWPRRRPYRPALLASLSVFVATLIGGSHPVQAVALNPGDIVVADPNETNVPGRIVRVDPDSGAQEIVADNLKQPYWVVVDATGDLLVSDRGSPGRIIRIDRSTGAQTTVSEGQFFGSPYGLAMAPSGETRNERHNRILRIDPGTGVQTLVFP